MQVGNTEHLIGLVLPHFIKKFAYKYRINEDEGMCAGVIGSMQAVEASHHDVKVAISKLTHGRHGCWKQVMEWDSIIQEFAPCIIPMKLGYQHWKPNRKVVDNPCLVCEQRPLNRNTAAEARKDETVMVGSVTCSGEMMCDNCYKLAGLHKVVLSRSVADTPVEHIMQPPRASAVALSQRALLRAVTEGRKGKLKTEKIKVEEAQEEESFDSDYEPNDSDDSQSSTDSDGSQSSAEDSEQDAGFVSTEDDTGCNGFYDRSS